jgi:hypothetical protein
VPFGYDINMVSGGEKSSSSEAFDLYLKAQNAEMALAILGL